MPNYKKVSQKQESKVAKEVMGKPTIASGALYFQKADVRSTEYLIECKTTEKTYYSLKLSTWLKIEKEALRDSMRVPMMQIDLQDGNVRYIIMKSDDFAELFMTKLYTDIGYADETVLTNNKSIRITRDLLDTTTGLKYPVRRIKFKEKSLVLLTMSDFKYMKEEVNVNE